MRNAALIIQKVWRGYGPRKRYLKIHHGCCRLQARIKSRVCHFEFKKRRKVIIALQVDKTHFSINLVNLEISLIIRFSNKYLNSI